MCARAVLSACLVHSLASHKQVGLQGVFDVLGMHILVPSLHQQSLHRGRRSLVWWGREPLSRGKLGMGPHLQRLRV